MKIRTLLGLTVIGSAVYAHKRNGGEFSVESMKKSLHDLWSGIQGKASDVKAKAAELADKMPDKVKGVADSARAGATVAAAGAATGAKDVLGPAVGKPAEPAGPAHSATNGPVPGGLGRGR
jgi:hypothetical protein